MEIDDVLRKPIEAGLIPGVVALAADDRGVFYEGAFGWRAVDKPEPMTPDSVFRIASMTKAVTGTAAMQLVEEGRIGPANQTADRNFVQVRLVPHAPHSLRDGTRPSRRPQAVGYGRM